mmetsp:Transcript_42774/g.83856  ORF Transcript_42774/g.83856 Transcript_42774/m.83856 type:complete len:99 (+) Transcript_42774:64-360(+)
MAEWGYETLWSKINIEIPTPMQTPSSMPRTRVPMKVTTSGMTSFRLTFQMIRTSWNPIKEVTAAMTMPPNTAIGNQKNAGDRKSRDTIMTIPEKKLAS